MARSLACAGARPGDVIHNAYGYGLFTGGLGAHYGAIRVGASVIPMSGGNSQRQIMMMQDFGSTVLTVTPSFLMHIYEVGEQMGVDFRKMKLKVGLFGAEPWSESMRQSIDEKFGIKACDMYGLSEMIGPGVSFECHEMRNGLHVNEDYFYPEIIDPETGEVLPDGEKGELVCAAPFPSMPVGFWNDPDDLKYRAAYFEHFPGVWRHGDWCEITEHGGMVIYGRSDATLNPGGVRIGTAEIYRQVEQLDEVVESLVIGQTWPPGQLADVRVVLFVKLREGVVLDDALRDEIRKLIRQTTTPRHVPAKIIQVSDIPRTISGKIVELAVRNVVHGRPVKNTDALANPGALELYRDLAELRD